MTECWVLVIFPNVDSLKISGFKKIAHFAFLKKLQILGALKIIELLILKEFFYIFFH